MIGKRSAILSAFHGACVALTLLLTHPLCLSCAPVKHFRPSDSALWCVPSLSHTHTFSPIYTQALYFSASLAHSLSRARCLSLARARASPVLPLFLKHHTIILYMHVIEPGDYTHIYIYMYIYICIYIHLCIYVYIYIHKHHTIILYPYIIAPGDHSQHGLLQQFFAAEKISGDHFKRSGCCQG